MARQKPIVNDLVTPLLDKLYGGPPHVFSQRELQNYPRLFEERLALIFTPTQRIPTRFIGSGNLSITLPLPMPSLFDLVFRTGYQSPKLWLDLFQRATQRIRWTPISPAKLQIIMYDSYRFGGVDWFGQKGLVDALKFSTTGRRDGKLLYYFGAILDDNPKELARADIQFRQISDPSKARVKIRVTSV